MLIDFSVENYRSIAEEQTISFVASKHKSDALGEPARQVDGFEHKLLTSAVIFGPNASGKTNIIRALSEFVERLSNSASSGEHYIVPFLLSDEWKQKPTKFSITFVLNGCRYQYGYSLDANIVHEEWLIAYPNRLPQNWFYRKANEPVVFGAKLKGEKQRLFNMTRPNALFLAVAAQFNHEQLSPIHKWLTQNIRVGLISSFPIANMVRLLELGGNMEMVINGMLKAADMAVEAVRIKRYPDLPVSDSTVPESKKRPAFRDGKGDALDIQTVHRTSEGREVHFDFSDESNGTQLYFRLLEPLLQTLINGGVLAVDELDSGLHPLLVKQIIKLFHSGPPNQAQLLFNTHDVTLLDPELFRRDQIWLVAKEENRTCVQSLLEFSPRRGEALQKGYLDGRYGAVPFLASFGIKGLEGS